MQLNAMAIELPSVSKQKCGLQFSNDFQSYVETVSTTLVLTEN